MAVLSAADRNAVSADLQREFSGERGHAVTLKADTLAMISALDDFFNTNAAAINSAIPLPARNVFTTSDKARAGVKVLTQRYLSGA